MVSVMRNAQNHVMEPYHGFRSRRHAFGMLPRSSSTLSHPFLGEGSPTKLDYRKRIGYPYSNLSAGGPRFSAARLLALESNFSGSIVLQAIESVSRAPGARDSTSQCMV